MRVPPPKHPSPTAERPETIWLGALLVSEEAKKAEDAAFRARAEEWRRMWAHLSDAWVHPANRRKGAA